MESERGETAPAETDAAETTPSDGHDSAAPGGDATSRARKSSRPRAARAATRSPMRVRTATSARTSIEAKPSLALVVTRVTNGKSPMPSFKGQLTREADRGRRRVRVVGRRQVAPESNRGLACSLRARSSPGGSIAFQPCRAEKEGPAGEPWVPPPRTERAGFEPATQLSPRTRFPVALLRPLGHLSRASEG